MKQSLLISLTLITLGEGVKLNIKAEHPHGKHDPEIEAEFG